MKRPSRFLTIFAVAILVVSTVGGSVLALENNYKVDVYKNGSDDINDEPDDSDDRSDDSNDDINDAPDDSDGRVGSGRGSDDINDDTPNSSGQSGNGRFRDVDDHHWAYSNIKRAWELGLVSGYQDGSFMPSAALKAEDTMVFLDRIMNHHDMAYLWMDRIKVEDRLRDRDRDSDDGKWYYENMVSVSSKLSDQTLDTLLALGQKPVTRGLLAQMIYEITDGLLPQTKTIPNYKDIDNSEYKMALEYVAKAGIMGGTSATQMSPLKPVTRAELMTIVIRMDDSFDDSIFDDHRGGRRGSDDDSDDRNDDSLDDRNDDSGRDSDDDINDAPDDSDGRNS